MRKVDKTATTWCLMKFEVRIDFFEIGWLLMAVAKGGFFDSLLI